MNVYLIRHADPVDRGTWREEPTERPLSSRGQRQATEIMQWFKDRTVSAVHSSTAIRCVTTIQPTCEDTPLTATLEPRLAEGFGPGRILELIDTQYQTGLIICSHGDSIPEALHLLEMRGITFSGARHSCAKASIWTLNFEASTALYTGPPR